MKALGHGMAHIGFDEIEVIRSDAGVPSLVLSGRARTLAEAAGVTRWHLSLTHTSSMAHAVVVAVGGQGREPVE